MGTTTFAVSDSGRDSSRGSKRNGASAVFKMNACRACGEPASEYDTERPFVVQEAQRRFFPARSSVEKVRCRTNVPHGWRA